MRFPDKNVSELNNRVPSARDVARDYPKRREHKSIKRTNPREQPGKLGSLFTSAETIITVWRNGRTEFAVGARPGGA